MGSKIASMLMDASNVLMHYDCHHGPFIIHTEEALQMFAELEWQNLILFKPRRISWQQRNAITGNGTVITCPNYIVSETLFKPFLCCTYSKIICQEKSLLLFSYESIFVASVINVNVLLFDKCFGYVIPTRMTNWYIDNIRTCSWKWR